MSRRGVLLVILAVVVVLGLAGGGAAWLARPKKNTVTLDVTGKAGAPFKATVEEDGRTRELTGTVPTKIDLEGARVTYLLIPTEDAAVNFRVKSSCNGVALEFSGTGDPPRKGVGVRGWVKSGWASPAPDHWIENFEVDGDKGWLKPMP
jgi:hypothetical protein